ncbi:hypothetical protein AN958_02918 [Leucoagaricus sp. SymC.cos]|nr:hypothetical protein AN958_02918 [Leucoagaricus sp. SymC.cos]
MLSTFAQFFSMTYGFGAGVGGLAYLGLRVGFFAATVFGGKFAGQIYAYLSAKNGGVGKPEMRIPALFFGSLFVPVGLFSLNFAYTSSSLLLSSTLWAPTANQNLLLVDDSVPATLYNLPVLYSLRTLGIAMSTFSLLSGVPVLVGEKNWVEWSELMENILLMTTLPGLIYTTWDIADGIVAIPQLIVDTPAVQAQVATATTPAVPAQAATFTAASVKAQNNWQSLDRIARGMINNRLSGHLLHHNQTSTPLLWTHLMTLFRTRSAAAIFADYQVTVSFHIDSNVELSSQLALLENTYSRLERSVPPIHIPEFVHAMNLLNAIPREWSYIVTTYLQTHPLANINYASVRSAILTQWQHQHQVCAHEANMSRAGMRSDEGDKKKKPHKRGKGSKGQQANSADAELVLPAVAAAAPDIGNTYVASSAFAVANPAIITNPKVSGLLTRKKVNDARASRAAESAVPPRLLAERLSTPVEESLIKRLKFKKTHYQAAGQKALELWDERLGATTTVPSVTTRGSSPLFSAPSLPCPAISLPPPQSPLNALPPPTSAPDADMISLGDDASDYGDDNYVPNYGLDDGTVQGQAAEVEHLHSLGLSQEPPCQCCPFGRHVEFNTLMDCM